MGQIVWSKHVLDLMAELPPEESALIFEKAEVLQRFPRLYPSGCKGRFRRHRHFLAGQWLVYYRVVDETAYIRAVWPARIP